MTSFDPLVTDPAPEVAPAASTPAVTFDSAGAALLGVLHLPAGPGPHPVVVLLHGFPGNERNFDLAQALRRAGYASLVFHYRGSWGVGGSWSWGHVLEDAARVVSAVREPEFAAAHRLDTTRTAVVGHSPVRPPRAARAYAAGLPRPSSAPGTVTRPAPGRPPGLHRRPPVRRVP
ncbi:hypothetical protein [Actinoallomurus sp. NPDC050550]|uniref:alpha/beta hydrolase family protein n=1 Tax=Actinoallomurus sp. NPDC050550 TaxID=3154937 RepID=UPI0034031FFB